MRMKFVWFLLVSSVLPLHLVSGADTSQTVDGANTAALKSYQIRNSKFGNLLRPEEANNANGTRIVLYPAQPWKCMTWKFHPAGESRFQLQNHFTSKTFSTEAGEKAAVRQVPFSKKTDERPVWQITKLNDGTYKIAEPKSGKVLTATNDANGSGARVVVENWHDGEEQKWELKEIDPKDLTM